MKVKFKSFEQLCKESDGNKTMDYWFAISRDRVREFIEAHKNRHLVAEISNSSERYGIKSVRLHCDGLRLFWPIWLFEEVNEDDS